jgi:NAD(P)-dependent dehydrogenase (short-subunit alcohol dehydrogenase family)
VDLDGASVLLTGGSRGLGPYIARALLARGARVTLSARSEDDLDRVRATFPQDRVAVVPGDVTNDAIARRTSAYRIQRREAEAQSRKREG